MKKSVSLILIAVLIFSSLSLSACGDKPEVKKMMEFIKYDDLNDVKDQKTQELLDSLTFLPEVNDWECICILTEDAQGDIEIPRMYENDFVALVTAYPGACENITSIKFNYGISFLEHICTFDSDNPSLTSVTIDYDWLPCFSDCFNRCTSLTMEEFPIYISDLHPYTAQNSFNGCKSLEAFDFPDVPEQTDSLIEASFCDCEALSSISLNSFDTVKDAFNRCSKLESVALSGTIATVEDAFNACSELESVALSGTIATVKDSFNRSSKLESVSLSGEIAFVIGSFNDCTALKSLELEHNSKIIDSFQNSQVKIDNIKSEEERIKEEEEAKRKKEEEERKKKEEEEAKKPYMHLSDFRKIIDEAWQKLADSGAIPEYNREDSTEATLRFEYDKTYDDMNLKFEDESVKDRLYAEPDYELNQVAVMTYDAVLNDDFTSDRIAKYYKDCRYLIVYEGFDSKLVGSIIYLDDFSKDGSSIYDKTTLVYIIDIESKEILTIHNVGTDHARFNDRVVTHNAEVLAEEAESYIRSLLE